MNRTSHRIGHGLLLTLFATIAANANGALNGYQQGVLSGLSLGQTDQAKPSAAKPAEVAELLKAARKAMAQGNLNEAEQKLQRAETANIRYPLLHFGDTPTKVRRDLNAHLQKSRQQKENISKSDGKGSIHTDPFLQQASAEGIASLPNRSEESYASTPGSGRDRPKEVFKYES